MTTVGPGLLLINGLYKEYRAGEPVLKNVNLSIDASGLTAIIGPSGTGKSTLIRCINRLIDPTDGQIMFMGLNLAQLKGKPCARRVATLAWCFKNTTWLRD